MKLRVRNSLFAFVWLLTACNTTKFVPDGEFLLDKVTIKTDNKDLQKEPLADYLRQTPNSSILGIYRMQLGIYNLAPRDTSKWLSKTFRKIGDPPVIFSPELTSTSAAQIRLLLTNKGYINAKVETNVRTKGKKAKVVYDVTGNKPYRLRNYNIDLKNEELAQIAADTSKSRIRPNMLFDTDVLNSERERITSSFRKQGFYNFIKECLTFSADSSLKSNQVDVTIELRDYLKQSGDSVTKLVFKKYTIGRVIYYINTDAGLATDINDKGKLDIVEFRGFELRTPKSAPQILKLRPLVQNTFINPEAVYSDDAVERTYQALNSLGPVKYVNISFKENGDNVLDCYIIIEPAKTVSLSAEAEGTYTAGYWGLAGNVNFVDRNKFKGAETFSLQSRAAVEWQRDVLAQEYGGQVGLKFPRFMLPVGSYDFKRSIHANTEFTGTFSYQLRPGEFTTTNVGAGINYSWNRHQYSHIFQLFDLSFVNFPTINPDFTKAYLSGSTPRYNPYNYKDHFIMRMGYTGSYSTFNANRPMKNFSSVRYSIESAGNLLYALSNLLGSPLVDGSYQLFKVRYSQYVKGEYNITRHQILNKDNRFVYHLGLGLGIPYGNADVIPYEKRFYSGGANSVRGWGESLLGPGIYKRITSGSRDFNQVGDIKLDMNMEYRAKMFWKMEGALFLDAGNVWTLKNYETQVGGQFKADSFLNQIAIAYGAGIRLDFSFFILRVDMGMKLYDPVLSRREKWRISPNFKNDSSWHFAIGYPF